MNRKKLIRRLAIPAAVICIVTIMALIFQTPFEKKQEKQHEERLKAHINELIQNYQKYVTETASKIKAIPVDPKIIGEIQSKILKENQVKLYLWLADKNGEFVFGSPAIAFAKMNRMYEKYKNSIQNDGHFFNQFDYLSKLISHNEEIDFSEFESYTVFKNQKYKWRFYKEGGVYRHNYIQPYRFLLSSLVTDETGKVIGEMFLKVDDFINHELYYRGVADGITDTLKPIFGFMALFSGMFLWFLLPAWVYTDARQRDVSKPGLWAFLALISLFFGLTIYLLARPENYKVFHCPQCENELNGTKAFCPHCGFDLSGTFCRQCQYPVKQSWQFCPNCRAKLQEPKKTEEGSK
ncbi:MAG: zinc ribbon domain-containing protein [Deltaproteobacteria bacterium]|nr:zinc ribbon domain-containing protein [Deltaproteobacteria bacterium]